MAAHNHAYAAIRAYAQIAGLPEPTDDQLAQVRHAMLGDLAGDQSKILAVTVLEDPNGSERALMQGNFKILSGK
ncbi:hypothetical protein HFO99_19435 [Rhizobium leguminosarum]|uniref:hypothetical protein n=1 Tax=Rhizobium leguminosarum TaxID=384 RepID=UPI001C97135D|nr:hypothetical protein [Rhizobium leguminosarum]MBY5336081.1 hypothetical protein [Rhizobium leguminosarum]